MDRIIAPIWGHFKGNLGFWGGGTPRGSNPGGYTSFKKDEKVEEEEEEEEGEEEEEEETEEEEEEGEEQETE